MLLEDIEYPVYRIRSDTAKLEVINKRVYIHTIYNSFIIDDKNLEGGLSQRRLKLLLRIRERKKQGFEYLPLYPLKEKINSFEQLIPNLKKGRRFIDSRGKIFNHAPTTYYSLNYYKVLRVAIVEASCALVFVKGITKPFRILRPPRAGTLYAGILHLADRDILYELSRTKKKDTKRKL